MPSDLTAAYSRLDTLGSPTELYEKSTVVIVDTIDLRAWHEIEFFGLRFETSQPHLSLRQGPSIKLEARKYRALFFLIPVET